MENSPPPSNAPLWRELGDDEPALIGAEIGNEDLEVAQRASFEVRLQRGIGRGIGEDAGEGHVQRLFAGGRKQFAGKARAVGIGNIHRGAVHPHFQRAHAGDGGESRRDVDLEKIGETFLSGHDLSS